jgi:hypothetical protein
MWWELDSEVRTQEGNCCREERRVSEEGSDWSTFQNIRGWSALEEAVEGGVAVS